MVTALLGKHRFFAAAALVHLARGARALGQWERAERDANEALRIARLRDEEANAQAASDLLKQIAARELAPTDTDPPDRETLARITRRFTSRLNNLPAPGGYHLGAGGGSATPAEA